jgi:putative DNA primase/helicase
MKLRLKRDPQVQSAILAWALEGCRAWQERGLVVPERVRRYTEEYRAENDPLADFFEERCVFEPRAVVRRSELRKAYEEWARENGEWPVAPRTLAGALKARGGNDGAKLGGEGHGAAFAFACRSEWTRFRTPTRRSRTCSEQPRLR